jgi:hypothetical protein
VFPVSDLTASLLASRRLDVDRLAALVAYDCSQATWSQMMHSEIVRFESLGWRLIAPLSILKCGSRDLSIIAHGLDSNSCAIAEIILGRVVELEEKAGLTQEQ